MSRNTPKTKLQPTIIFLKLLDLITNIKKKAKSKYSANVKKEYRKEIFLKGANSIIEFTKKSITQ